VFDLYWRVIGLPLSRFKGSITDSIPFSLVETALWVGSVATAFWIYALIRRHKTSPLLKKISFLLGPVFLLALGLGQGAFPLSLAPSAWRSSITKEFGTDSLGEAEFKAWVHGREDSLRSLFEWGAYQSLTEREALATCDHSLDTVLSDLGLPPGRNVHAFKSMGPITTTFGLVYGGPAFHDPFFGELAIVHRSDLPTSRHWRLIAACHEAAHAKGFTREMDAEILTQLALSRISDPRFQRLADIHFLEKAGFKIRWPDSLIAEGKRMRELRKETEKHQPVISFLRRWAEKWNLRNSGGKYGDREAKEAWNPRQPFYATVHRLQPLVEKK
jgi:hypothetical protein